MNAAYDATVRQLLDKPREISLLQLEPWAE